MFRAIARKYSSQSNIKYHQGLSKVNMFRENRTYDKENRVKANKKFYDITRETHNRDADCGNSLYKKENLDYKCPMDVCVCRSNGYKPKTLPYDKDSEIHPYIKDNYPLNVKFLVDDFNKKSNTNLTMELF